jgi:DNA polymerase I
MKKLLCIDGNSILNRAYYGIRMLTNRDGFPTNALYGMVNILSKQLETLEPDYAAIAYDLKAPTFRHRMYEAYKAGRRAMPDELAQQMPVSRKFAAMLGLHVLSVEGYEADDILGTLARMAEEDGGCTAYLLTGDRDALQLISPQVHVLLAGNSETADMDEAAFIARYGVSSDRFVDVKALMGDSSDNIPGVPGIGEKTALKLIAEYGSVDGVYAALPTAKLTPSVRRKLEEGEDSARLSRRLAEICREVPLGLSLDELVRRPMDRGSAAQLFSQYGFSGFIKRFGLTDAAVPIPCGEAAAASEAFVTAASDAEKDLTDEKNSSAVQIPEQARTVRADELTALPVGRWALSVGASADALELWNGGMWVSCPLGEEVGDFLCNPARQFVCYDCKTMYRELDAHGIRFRNCAYDVMLAAYVAGEGQGDCAPDRLCLTWLGHMPAAGENLLFSLLPLADALTGRLNETAQMNVFADIEMPLAAVLCDMEEVGFKIDRAAVRRYGDALDALIADMETRIYALAGHPFNINSPRQLGDVLFEEMKLPAGKKTKTGYATGAEVLEKLRHYHPIAEDILDYRQYTKLRSTYVEGLLRVADGEGHIHTTFKQTGTATGRLSSAEPNLQNIPIRTELGREMRKFFIPSRPDMVLIDADYSQIELRLLADIAGDKAMREAFIAGFDIHTDTASRVFGVEPGDVTVEMRKKAKAINFGLMYGMGEFSLAEDLHISRAEAKDYISGYMDSYPDIERYLTDIVKSAYAKGYVTTKAGRRRSIPELADSNKMRKKFGERVAMNSPIQGTAADIIKLAMIWVHRRLAEAGIRARMILQVHDELILEAEASCAGEAMEILRDSMEHAADLSVPLAVEAHIGKNWYEAH